MSKWRAMIIPPTCGTCRYFERAIKNGEPAKTGKCLKAEVGTVDFRRQSSRACSKKETDWGQPFFTKTFNVQIENEKEPDYV